MKKPDALASGFFITAAYSASLKVMKLARP